MSPLKENAVLLKVLSSMLNLAIIYLGDQYL